MKLRTGRSVGRTLYVQTGSEPSDDDDLVGTVDSLALAEAIVLAWDLTVAVSARARCLGPIRFRLLCWLLGGVIR